MRIASVLAAATFGLIAASPAMAGKNDYHLNIIGFANCDQSTSADCYVGSGDDSNGHSIFVPLRTILTDVCADGTSLPDPIEVADLQKGVRILVADGADLGVVDRDATDGLGRFTIPDGTYQIWVRALGKPGGCMEINTLICEDATTLLPEDCDPNLTGQQYVLVGVVDVKREKGTKPIWENVTSELLGGTTTLADGYFDFFWQIFNNNLRLLQVRFEQVN